MRTINIYGLSALLFANFLAGSTANAFSVSVDEFSIIKNGNTVWLDSFDDGVAPVDGADYSVLGTPGPESGGRLTLDSANAALTTNIHGDPRLKNRVRRKTSTGSDISKGLRIDDIFSVTGIFDISSIIMPNEQYGVSFTDNLGSPTSDKLDLFVKHTAPGDMRIQFRRQDNFNSILTILEGVAFVPGTNDQISLTLSRLNTGTNDITASFAYGTGGVFGSITTLATTATIFNDQNYTRAQFTATGPVPVPAAVWLFGSGLLGLIGIARRKKTT